MPHDEAHSEWLTRKRRIDPQLDALGWKRSTHALRGAYRIEEYDTVNGPADYALCHDAKVWGIVEAKKLSLGPQNVLTQAERYARGISSSPFSFDGLRAPFLYSTNGEVIWFHDVRHALNRSRKVACFHTPKARPRDWSTAALTERRDKLKQTRECFTSEMLQQAHEIRYKKALVDIISMVKHAAHQEPLLTAQERVGRAFDKLTARKKFTPAQQQWLDRIRAHLVENLSIDREDFDVAPVLERPGGWTVAGRALQSKLAQWLREVNEAIAA